MLLKIRALIAALALAAAIAPTVAGAADGSFATWVQDLRKEATGQGIKAHTFDAAFAGVAPIPRIIELDRKQPEFTLTFAEYLTRVVNDARVTKGRALLEQHKALLDRVAAKYRVQPRFIVALWGIETDFGRITGGYPVIAALATLAFDGRRSTFFRKQLIQALTILDQGHITLADMTGSWAGAMGQSQFMPSSFLAYAVDENGDGHKDIWKTLPDVFASIANYLARSGWSDDQTWGRPVTLPPGFDRGQSGLDTKRPLSAWQAAGVRTADGKALPGRNLDASIVLPSDSGLDPAFLAYENYRVILKWNRSTYFAVAVGTLADRLQGQ